MEIIYECLYNPECHESVARTISIHKTKEGAEIALKQHQELIKKEYDEEFIDDDSFLINFKWDSNRWWGIRETELKD